MSGDFRTRLDELARAGWVKSGAANFNTSLPVAQEATFRKWLSKNSVPFQPDEPITDYDMRGFWKALQSGDPLAKSAVDPNDKRMHYPDFWKTPLHKTFSNESQWATPDAPRWGGDRLVTANGAVLFDDRSALRSQVEQAFDQAKGRKN